MLVLSRKVGEVIVIGEGEAVVEVTVVEIRGDGKVRLGVKAPGSTRVDRLEISKRRSSGETRSEAA